MVITIKGGGGKDLDGISLQLTYGHIPGIELPISCPVANGIKNLGQFPGRAGRAYLFIAVRSMQIKANQGADFAQYLRVWCYDLGDLPGRVTNFLPLGFLEESVVPASV